MRRDRGRNGIPPVFLAGDSFRVFVARRPRARGGRERLGARLRSRAKRGGSSVADGVGGGGFGGGASFLERGGVLPPFRERSFRHGESLLRDGRAETSVAVHRVVFVAPVSSFGTLRRRLGRERLERGSLAFAVHQRRAQPLDLRARRVHRRRGNGSVRFVRRRRRSQLASQRIRRPRRLVQQSRLSLERALQLERDGLAQPQPPLEVLARRLGRGRVAIAQGLRRGRRRWTLRLHAAQRRFIWRWFPLPVSHQEDRRVRFEEAFFYYRCSTTASRH